MTRSMVVYEKPSVTADLVVFTIADDALKVLLVRREKPPFKGMWALPGGFVGIDEPLEIAALRELQEETGVKDLYLEQLYTYGDPKRDPRGRVITVAYYSLIKQTALHAASDASDARWWPVGALPQLAFDHAEILAYGLARLRNKMGYTTVAFQLLPDQFTLSDLQRVYEIVLGKVFDKRNFRKKIAALGILQQVREKKREGAHRPAQLYRFRRKGVFETQFF